MRLTSKQVERISSAISEPRRYRILKKLAASQAPMSCGAIAEHQGVTGATISHHIKELETADLIQVVRDGKFGMISLRREVWSAYVQHLASL